MPQFDFFQIQTTTWDEILLDVFFIQFILIRHFKPVHPFSLVPHQRLHIRGWAQTKPAKQMYIIEWVKSFAIF